jgi:hypothetical protein
MSFPRTGVMICSICWLSTVSSAADVDAGATDSVARLLGRAESNDAATRDTALAELGSDIKSGRLAAAPAGQIVDRALAVQADMSQEWATGWGDLIEIAHSTN